MKLLVLWVLLILQPAPGELYIVPDQAGYVGHFVEVDQYGVEAALAHDYLSGALFYQAVLGDLIVFDGRYYRVNQIKTLPAGFDPDYGFDLIYPGSGNQLILQTCYQGGWYFVIAEPTGAYDAVYQNRLVLLRYTEPDPVKTIFLPMVQR